MERALTSERELNAYEWALVNSGPRLAVRAALARLIRTGAIEWTATGLVTVGDGPVADPLELEVFADAGKRPRVFTLLLRVSRGPWVRTTSRRLMREGYLRSPYTRRFGALRTMIPALFLLLAGAVATIGGDSVTGLLFAVIGVIAFVVGLRTGLVASRATGAGTAALRERQTREAPSVDVPGVDPSLLVALFGMRALERSDPDLAAQVTIPFGDSASLED